MYNPFCSHPSKLCRSETKVLRAFKSTTPPMKTDPTPKVYIIVLYTGIFAFSQTQHRLRASFVSLFFSELSPWMDQASSFSGEHQPPPMLATCSRPRTPCPVLQAAANPSSCRLPPHVRARVCSCSALPLPHPASGRARPGTSQGIVLDLC
jgi:hypothetical protein